jgi:hypothetical protein
MWAHRDMKIQIPHCLGLTQPLLAQRCPQGGVPAALPLFLAGLKTKKTLIYQCFHFAKTAKIAIFGSLLLRSSCNSDKLNFYAWFMPLA